MYRFFNIKKQGLKSCRNVILVILGLPYIFQVYNLQYISFLNHLFLSQFRIFTKPKLIKILLQLIKYK